ncbi:RNA ligase family protein [Mucilaginibacter sp. PAMB04274]|uniref:RNA ligase family protein n=1 Tax=Mucilaginibacter sp. PAMB04274 TaxID=3138568 RepID=UPI0031F6D1DF
MNQYGVFARSHAAPATSPWTESLRRFWQLIKHDLGSLEIFLENLYAVHSIEYRNVENHFYVFAVREHDRWLSWEETQFYANMLDLPTVPVIANVTTPANCPRFQQEVQQLASGRGLLDPFDAFICDPPVDGMPNSRLFFKINSVSAL